MARRKNIPIKSSKSQAKGEGSRPRRNPKSQRNLIQNETRQTGIRLASKAHGDSRTAKTKKKRGRPQKIISSNLPPELRQAGLLASQDIVRGRCFGPFRGIINKKKKVPDSKHHFVCQVNSRVGETFYFHVLEEDKSKSSWLKLVKTCGNEQEQNMVAHNMAMGVCYEAIKDISAGEELVAFFDDSFGKKYPAYVEAVPTSILPSEAEQSDSTVAGATQNVQENGSVEEDKAVEVKIIDDDDNSDDGLTEEDETEGDDSDDDDPEYVPSHYTYKESRTKPLDLLGNERVTKKAITDNDELASEPAAPAVPEIVEVTTRDDEKDEETTTYRCTHCSTEFESRGTAEQHVESKECVKNLLCQLCGDTFTSDTLLEKHSCKGKPRCGTCNIVFESKLEKRLHLRKCHAEPAECPVCHKTYNRSYMRDHLQSHNANAFKCDICDKQFSSRSNLCKHKRKHNPDYVPAPDPRRSTKVTGIEYWCHKCNIQFETRAELRRHKRKEHPEPSSPVECPVCHKKYNNNYMRDHLKSHNSDAFKCDICEKLFSSRSNLSKHKRKHNPDYVPRPSERKCAGPKRHECEECQKKFDTPTALEVHRRSHTGERPFACEQCNWKFSQKTHLTRHVKTVHNPGRGAEDGGSGRIRQRAPGESATEQRNVPCETCGKTYASLRVLQVHMQTVHLGERPHKCNHCEATFTQRGHLWRHKHSVHPNAEEVKRKVESGKHACNFEGCGKAFPCHSDLLRHVAEHTGEKQFLCDQCGAAFATKGNLNKHKRSRHKVDKDGNVTNSDTFPCSLCGKVFSTAAKLQFHTRSHTGEKPYKCEMCNQGFVQRSGLSKHIRCKRCPMIEGPPENPYSSKVKKHECKECNRRFLGPSDLKAHERTHTGEKPFQCTICLKAFSQPGNLSKHIRYIHRKEKRPKEKPRERRFFCSLCGKSFMCPSSLNMHCRTHTGSKPFACELCDQSFAQAGNLKKHVNRCHDERACAERKNRSQKRKAVGEKKSGGRKQRRKADKDAETSSSEDENSSIESENESGNEQGKENDTDDVVASMCEVPRSSAEQPSPVPPLPMHPPLFMSTFPRTPLNTATHGYFLSPLNTMMTTGPSFMMRAQLEGPQGPTDSHLATPRVQNIETNTTVREQCLNSDLSKHPIESRNHIQSSNGSVRPVLASSVTSTEHPGSQTSSQSSFLESVEGILSPVARATLSPVSGVSSTVSAALPHMHTMLNTRMTASANIVPEAVGQDIHGTSSDINIFQFAPNLFQQP